MLKAVCAIVALIGVYIILYGGSVFLVLWFGVWCLGHLGVLH